MTTFRRRTVHRALAAAGLALGAMAAASGDASSRETAPTPGGVSALELARWIRDARPNLRVVDLRGTESFDAFSIPGAERMTLDDLALARVQWEREGDVVVYADSAAAARRAQAALRLAGVRNVHVLAGGVGEWVNTIVAPVLPANPSPAEAGTWREIAEMSRWFGGVPRVGDPQATSDNSVRAALGRVRRRGC